MAKYIFDENGNLKKVIKNANSITISSDQGKGSMKSILAFNSPGYRIGAAESIMLTVLKAREESHSLELLMESSWPLTIRNFANELKIPIFS